MSAQQQPQGYASLQKVRVVTETAPARSPVRPPPLPARTPSGETGPYRAYAPRPFTRDERDRVTMLFGGLHWRVERLIQGAMENLGYRTRVLPTATRADLLTGREVADIGQCC